MCFVTSSSSSTWSPGPSPVPTLAVIEKALSPTSVLEVAETKQRGHASELGAQAVADGVDLVIVFSGDGTK